MVTRVETPGGASRNV